MSSVKWRVQDVAKQHGIETPNELARRVDIALNTAKALWRGDTQRVDLPTLRKICDALGVTIGDLLEYQQPKSLTSAAA